MQFSEKSQRDAQSRDDGFAGKRPVAVSTQRPEPLPWSCRLRFIVVLTMNLPPTRSRRRRDTSREAVPVNSRSTLLLKLGVRLASRRLDSRVRTRRLASRGLESRDCFGIRLPSRKLDSRVYIRSAVEFFSWSAGLQARMEPEATPRCEPPTMSSRPSEASGEIPQRASTLSGTVSPTIRLGPKLAFKPEPNGI